MPRGGCLVQWRGARRVGRVHIGAGLNKDSHDGGVAGSRRLVQRGRLPLRVRRGCGAASPLYPAMEGDGPDGRGDAVGGLASAAAHCPLGATRSAWPRVGEPPRPFAAGGTLPSVVRPPRSTAYRLGWVDAPVPTDSNGADRLRRGRGGGDLPGAVTISPGGLRRRALGRAARCWGAPSAWEGDGPAHTRHPHRTHATWALGGRKV